MIRIGLVGCGHIGTVHSYAIKQLVDAGLVDAALTATYDTDRERAARVAAHHDARPAASLAELVEGVDAVWVCTWTAAHLEAVSAAADAGRAIFCEKPLAPTLEACERVAAALERVPHQVGLVLRHAPVFARAAELVGSGRYGRPLATTLRDDQYFPIQGQYGSTWRKDVAAAGGGTLIEHSIHDVDILRWLLGDPVTVAAHTANRFGYAGIDDIVAMTMTYADGSAAQLTSVWHQVLSRESSRRLEVFCEGAYLWTEDDYLGPLHVQTSEGAEVVESPLPEWAERLAVPEVYAKAVAAYATPTKEFLDALTAGGGTAVGHPSAATALAAHRIVARAYALRGPRRGSGIARCCRRIEQDRLIRGTHPAPRVVGTTGAREWGPMPLSEEEQKILKEIEAQLNATDPALVEQVSRTTLYRHSARMIRWAALGFLGGLVLLVFTFAENLWAGLIGFAVMLGCLLIIERNVRKLGKHGLASITGGLKAGGGLKGFFGEHGRAWRERFRRDDS